MSLKLQHPLSVIVVFNKLVVAPNLIAMYKPKNFNDTFGLCRATQSAPRYMGSNLN